MTDEELKKYREQIERLKRDFHGENSHNIENRNPFLKPIDSFEKASSGSLLSELKSLNNYSDNVHINIPKEIIKNNIPISQKIYTDESIDVPESINEVEIKNEIFENNSEPITNEAVNEDLILKIEEPIVEKTISEVSESKIVTESNEIIPPIISPTENTEIDEEKKPSIFKYILMLLALILLGFLAYYFYNKNNQPDVKNDASINIEKLYADSVLAYQEEIKIQKEIEEKYAEEKAAEESAKILISDTIFNLTDSLYSKGYYAIIGSFESNKNAIKTKSRNKTVYEAFIFNTDKIRLGLKISDDENQVLIDLEEVRKNYPEAWLIYNKN